VQRTAWPSCNNILLVKVTEDLLGVGEELTIGMTQQRARWPMAAQTAPKLAALVTEEGAINMSRVRYHIYT